MADKAAKLCAFADCATCCSFNFPGLTTPKYCAVHQEDGMMNVRHRRVLCGAPGGWHDQRATQTSAARCTQQLLHRAQGKYSGVHKAKGMVNVGHRHGKGWLPKGLMSVRDRQAGSGCLVGWLVGW